MKTERILILLLALALGVSIVSCVEDGDFTIPQSLGTEENAELQQLLVEVNAGNISEISIPNLKTLFVKNQATEITSDLVVKGYVTSSDAKGNFYKEIFIQDKEENPTAAIKVIVELTNSYNKFNVGREVYINLKGLFIGEVRAGDGVIAIGGKKNEDNEVENLSISQVQKHILRSATTKSIVPLELKLSHINNSHIGMFVKVTSVHFPASLAGRTYHDPNNLYDTQRTLESCDGFGYVTFILETSAFAQFSFEVMPSGGGSISAIVSKTFNGSNLVLVLNDNTDVNMNGSKCKPLNRDDFTIVVEENFDSGTDNSILDFPGWVNFAEAGSQLWTEQIFSGNGYAEFSGYRTNDAINIGWLVSPGVDLGQHNSIFVNFRLAQHHLDSPLNILEVFVSTDFDGINVTAATWQPITVNLPTMNDSWYQFRDAGLIDLSSYSGKLYVGFKFYGSGTDTTLDGAYMIDDFRILVQ